MSIWCSWPAIGHDPHDEEPLRGGEVRTYATGWSNHFPTADGEAELPASIDLADIAPWCVPGHEQDAANYRCTGCGAEHDHPECGPWLRLGLYAEQSRTWHGSLDSHGVFAPIVSTATMHATVVLDEDAARALRDDLTAWLDRPKVRPRRDA